MSGLVFQHPEAGWALLTLVLAFLLWRAIRRRRRGRFAAIGILSLLAARVHRAAVTRRAPALLGACMLAATGVALMDPVLPYSEERIESRGVDIALVLDLSASMQEAMSTAADASPLETRLEVTTKALSDFIARRPDDRIGLLVFSDNAYVLSPLTLDHASLQRHVSMIDAKTIEGEGMTAIGEGVALASALLTRQTVSGEPRERVILVLTDGENTAGREPVSAVSEAFDAGAQLYLVGVDLEDEIKQRPQVLRLVRTVEARGGRYFTADSAGQLEEVARAVDALERGVLASTRYIYNAPAFESFTAVALGFICAAFLLRCLPYFVDLT